MRKFIYRFKLCFAHPKDMSFSLLKQFTFMDIGRWFFKKAHNCNICGSLNVVGHKAGIGLHCPECRDRE